MPNIGWSRHAMDDARFPPQGSGQRTRQAFDRGLPAGAYVVNIGRQAARENRAGIDAGNVSHIDKISRLAAVSMNDESFSGKQP